MTTEERVRLVATMAATIHAASSLCPEDCVRMAANILDATEELYDLRWSEGRYLREAI
jgi:hypothetical protein